MKTSNFLLFKCLGVLWLLLALCVLPGCQQPAAAPSEPVAPTFYPALPEKPRLQFLKAYAKSDDFVEKVKRSSFDQFLLGAEEEVKGKIVTPYGVAMHDGKIYVCDPGSTMVEVLDIRNKSFGYLTKDRRLANPVGIWIEDDGTKYITDPKAGGVYVFDSEDKLKAILGKDLNIRPTGVVTRGDRCYITDFVRTQVLVLNKTTGELIGQIGKEFTDTEQTEADENAQFRMISDLAIDQEGNIYVTDRLIGQLVKFDSSGRFVRSFGHLGDLISSFVRPKGIAVDRDGRIWVVDAATQVGKIYDKDGRFLLYFGLAGAGKRGGMNLPAGITLDYDNVALFQEYAVEGAQIEFLVIVTNQYGLNKVAVYGFGTFPEQEKQIAAQRGETGSTEDGSPAPAIKQAGVKEDGSPESVEKQKE